ncbi:MAG: hypothetical protein Kapaf2KO_15900 [Candidatus Kapaibacteriales bacterium]
MKFLLLFLISFLGFNYLLSETEPEKPTDTDGNGYINISTLAHLRWLTESPDADMNANYELDNDIDASETREWNEGTGFEPIGSWDNHYMGVFDGLGYNINNLYIDRFNVHGGGFLEYLGSEGIVKNLNIISCDFNLMQDLGGITAYNYGIIEGCKVSGSLSVGSVVGGIAGRNFRIISKSICDVVIKANHIAGGIAGQSSKDSIVECVVNGNITAKYNMCGGIIGHSEESTIVNCIVYADISAIHEYIGLIGFAKFSGITNCLYLGKINSEIENLEGAIGECNICNVDKVFFHEQSFEGNLPDYIVKGDSFLKNYQNFATWDFLDKWDINDTINNGIPYLTNTSKWVKPDYIPRDIDKDDFFEISSVENLEWIVRRNGEMDHNYILENDIDFSINPHSQKTFKLIPKFSGTFNGNNHIIKNIELTGEEGQPTGLIGEMQYDSKIYNMGLGNIVVNGTGIVGGLVGENYGTIEECFITGYIYNAGNSEEDKTGGIAGINHMDVINSYANCIFDSDNGMMGGLVGEDIGFLITNSYAVSTDKKSPITMKGLGKASSDIQGFHWGVKDDWVDNALKDSWFRTNAELRDQNTFLGWDFDNIWAIDPDINDGYPYLRGTEPILNVNDTNAKNFQNTLKIYPNPSSNLISIESEEGAISEVYIYNILGNMLLTSKSPSSIDISTLPHGNYIIVTQSPSGTYITGKFEKN